MRRKKLFAGGTALKKIGSSKIKAPVLPAKPKKKISPANKQVGKAKPIARKKPVAPKPKSPKPNLNAAPAVQNALTAARGRFGGASRSSKKVNTKPKGSGGGSPKPVSNVRKKLKKKLRSGG